MSLTLKGGDFGNVLLTFARNLPTIYFGDPGDRDAWKFLQNRGLLYFLYK